MYFRKHKTSILITKKCSNSLTKELSFLISNSILISKHKKWFTYMQVKDCYTVIEPYTKQYRYWIMLSTNTDGQVDCTVMLASIHICAGKGML